MRQQVTVKLYEILRLPDFANKQELKKAHKKLCLVHHPDRGGDLDRMKRINAAYDFLMRHKEHYDTELKKYYRMKQGIQIQLVRPGYNWGGMNASTTSSGTYGGTDEGAYWSFHF